MPTIIDVELETAREALRLVDTSRPDAAQIEVPKIFFRNLLHEYIALRQAQGQPVQKITDYVRTLTFQATCANIANMLEVQAMETMDELTGREVLVAAAKSVKNLGTHAHIEEMKA